MTQAVPTKSDSMTYQLWGYAAMYTKDSDWVLISSYQTETEAKGAKAYRLQRSSGRNLGGFDKYEITTGGPPDDYSK